MSFSPLLCTALHCPQYLKRFKLFILESDTKRARAEKKESEEHRQRLLKLREIEQHRALFLTLQSTRSTLKAKNDHYKQNKNYLESVKDSVPEQYSEIDELIVRYQILKQTNVDLTESNRLVSERMEAVSADLQNLYKTKQNDILVKNSKFAHLLQKLESVTNDTSNIENETAAVELRNRDGQRYFCEVSMAIKNIYARTMSSLPSKKAATQMKKRIMQQNAILAARDGAAGGATRANGRDDAASGGAGGGGLTNSVSSQSNSRASTAASAHRSSAFDSDLDSDDEDGEAVSEKAQSAAAAAAALAASEDHSASLSQSQTHSKNMQVKAHLIQLLDSIAERLVDLQFIVDQVHPNGAQLLREGGSLYSPGLAAAAALVSGGGGAGALSSQQGAGGPGTERAGGARFKPVAGRNGGGGGGDSTADSSRRGGMLSSHATGSRQQISPSMHSSQRSHSQQTIGGGGAGGGGGGGGGRRRGGFGAGSDSESESESNSRASTAALAGVGMPATPLSPEERRGASRVELENKMRAINANLASSGMLGVGLNARQIPVHQMAVQKDSARKNRSQRLGATLGLPPISKPSSASRSRSSPRSSHHSPRRS